MNPELVTAAKSLLGDIYAAVGEPPPPLDDAQINDAFKVAGLATEEAAPVAMSSNVPFYAALRAELRQFVKDDWGVALSDMGKGSEIDEELWAEIQAAVPKERPATLPAIVGTLRDGTVNVVVVDGDKIMLADRHEKSNRGYDEPDHMDFVVAGNTQEDPDLFQAVWGRPNDDDQQEVYLDDRVDLDNWRFNCYHEEGERTYMDHDGLKYGDAHDEVTPQEKALRLREGGVGLSTDTTGREHAPAGTAEGGRFVAQAHELEAMHPFPPPRPPGPPGMGNPVMLEADPALREAARQESEHTSAYHRAFTAGFVRRMLAAPEPRLVPTAGPADSRANRVHRAKKALERAAEAEADLIRTDDAFRKHHQAVAESHPQGQEMLEAAKKEAVRRYRNAVAAAEANVQELPEELREAARRSLGKRDIALATAWVREPAPTSHFGYRWRNPSGEVRYQPDEPGERGAGQPEQPAPAFKPREEGQESAQKGQQPAQQPAEQQILVPPGNLGIDRAQMPQIEKSDLPDFLAKLERKNVPVHPDNVPAGSLHATQNELNAGKMREMLDALGIDAISKNKVIVSEDGYVLDGHHRWGAVAMTDPRHGMEVLKVGLPIRDLLREAHLYAKTKYKSVGEEAPASSKMYRPPSEASKNYAKSLLPKTPEPDELPEVPEDYFLLEGATSIPIDKIKPMRARPDGIANAGKFMYLARKGLVPKRAPVSVIPQPDGTYLLADGNSTYANAKKFGWKHIPVTIEGQEAIAAHEHGAKAKPPAFFGPEVEHLPQKAASLPAKSYAELKPHAEQADRDFRKLLNIGKGLAAQLGYETIPPGTDWGQVGERLKRPGGVLILAPVKGEQRAAEKVETDYKGDWSKLTDAVRATIAVDTVEDLHKTVEKLKAAGVEFAEAPKDRIKTPMDTGYRDIKTNIRMPNGMVAELQLHLKPMLHAKEFGGGHAHYEKMRDIEGKYNRLGHWYPNQADLDAYREAFESSVKLYDSAWKQATAKKHEGAG